MTDDELLKHVLEHEGWTKVQAMYLPNLKRQYFLGVPPGKTALLTCPDYLNDRNAVAELVGQLSHDEKLRWAAMLIKWLDPTYDYEIALFSPSTQLKAYWKVVK